MREIKFRAWDKLHKRLADVPDDFDTTPPKYKVKFSDATLVKTIYGNFVLAPDGMLERMVWNTYTDILTQGDIDEASEKIKGYDFNMFKEEI